MLPTRYTWLAGIASVSLLVAFCTPTNQQISRLYVSEASLGNGGTILAYALPINRASQPIGVSYNPNKNYIRIATDSGGAVYAVNNSRTAVGQPTVEIFVPFQGVTTPKVYEKTFAHPYDIAVDHNGDVFVAERCDGDPQPCFDQIEVWKAPLDFNQHSAFQIPMRGVESITFDLQNDLWVMFRHQPYLAEYIGPFSENSTPVLRTTGGIQTEPTEIRSDNAGNVYVVLSAHDGVGIYRPPFSDSMTPTPTLSVPSSSFPQAVAFDNDGAAYVAMTSALIIAYLPRSSTQNTSLRPPLDLIGALAIGQGPPGSPIPIASPTP